MNKKVRKSRCIERKSGVESGPELKNHSRPLHPQIAIILDLSEHVDVDDDPEEAEQRGMINCNIQRWRSRQKITLSNKNNMKNINLQRLDHLNITPMAPTTNIM